MTDKESHDKNYIQMLSRFLLGRLGQHEKQPRENYAYLK